MLPKAGSGPIPGNDGMAPGCAGDGGGVVIGVTGGLPSGGRTGVAVAEEAGAVGVVPFALTGPLVPCANGVCGAIFAGALCTGGWLGTGCPPRPCAPGANGVVPIC